MSKKYEHNTKKIREDLTLDTVRNLDGKKTQWCTLSIPKAKLVQLLRWFYSEELRGFKDSEIGLECRGGISTGENTGEITDGYPLMVSWEPTEEQKQTLEILNRIHTKTPAHMARKYITGPLETGSPKKSNTGRAPKGYWTDGKY